MSDEISNKTAEEYILGIMLLYAEIVPDIAAQLDEKDFFFEQNAKLYKTLKLLFENGEEVNAVAAISNGFSADFVTNLVLEVISPSQCEFYIKEIKNCKKRRDLIIDLKSVIQSAKNNDENYVQQLESALEKVRCDSIENLSTVSDKALIAAAEIGNIETGLSTGFYEIDNTLNGLQKGHMIIVGGRPSMGKTSFAMNIAIHAAMQGKTVAVFSLETSIQNMLQRAVISLAKCSAYEVQEAEKNGYTEQRTRLINAGIKIAETNLYIFDNIYSPSKIKSQCYRIKNKNKGLDLVVVDYLQLMKTQEKKNGTREQEVSDLSRTMKLMAKELNIPIVLLAQLNRSIENRADPAPKLSDIRESGALEQDADEVLFMYRPFVYQLSDDPTEAYVNIAKHKDGETGSIPLRWEGKYFLFSNENDWIE